jgi:hypothetical protein
MIVVASDVPKRRRPYASAAGAARARAARDVERFRDLLGYTWFLQRDYDRERMHAGLPPVFSVIPFYSRGVTPLTLPQAAHLQSWHASSLGLTLGTALVPTIGTDPAVNWDSDVALNLAPRVDIPIGGVRGVATYGVTLDGGSSYIQTGFTATFVSVPLLAHTLIFNTGVFTAGNQYFCVAKTMANQTPKLRTLNGAATDSSKPRAIARYLNGFPCLRGVAGTSGAMLDNTSTWAADVASGTNRNFSVLAVMATGSAAPSSVQALWSFGNTGAIDPDPAFYLATRNGTNLYRGGRLNDAGTSSVRDAGAIDTTPHLFTFLINANNLTLQLSGAGGTTTLVSNLSLGSGATTLDAVAIGCLYLNSGQVNANLFSFVEMTSYDVTLGGTDLTENQAYYTGKYPGLP